MNILQDIKNLTLYFDHLFLYIEEEYLYKTGFKPLTNNYEKISNHSRRNFFSRLINKIFFISISLIFKLLSNLKIINLELEIEVLIKRLRNY